MLVRESTNRTSITKIETATLGSIMVGKGEDVTTLRTIVTVQPTTFIRLDKAVVPLQNGRPIIVNQINTSDPNRTAASRRLSKGFHGTKMDVRRRAGGADRPAAEVTVETKLSRTGVMEVIVRIITAATRCRKSSGGEECGRNVSSDSLGRIPTLRLMLCPALLPISRGPLPVSNQASCFGG